MSKKSQTHYLQKVVLGASGRAVETYAPGPRVSCSERGHHVLQHRLSPGRSDIALLRVLASAAASGEPSGRRRAAAATLIAWALSGLGVVGRAVPINDDDRFVADHPSVVTLGN